MRIAKLLLAVASGLFLSGCGPMAWKTVVEKGSPSTFAWQGDTLWGFGAETVLRRDPNGTWERIELCAPYDLSTYYSNTKLPVNVAFEGAAVWALCGDNVLYDKQTLLRHDGSGTAAVIELPVDGTLQLVPVLDGPPALVGRRELYLWNGTSWGAQGEHPLAGKTTGPGRGAGRSTTEIYVEVPGPTASLMWWNGTKWQSMLGESAGAPTLRFGKAWSGLLTLEDGYYNPLAIKGEKALKDQGLTLASLLTADTLLAVRASGTQYFSIGVNDPEPVQLGSAPMGNRSGQTGDATVVDVYGNVGTVLSRGDNGSGIAFVYGVDRNTVLIGSTTGGGIAGGGSAYTTLVQGRR